MRLSVICMAVLMAALGMVPAFAADDDKLTINDAAQVKKGDKIKFTLNLSETTEDVYGFELRLFYDSEYLQLDKKSISSEKFDNMFYNANLDGKIPFNWTDIFNPVSFSKKSEFISCEYTVLKGGSTKLTYFVTELFGDDTTYLKSYKWTYDITVNGKKVIEDAVPLITDDQDTLNTRQSTFINYVDGMGEENTPNKDNHEAVIGTRHNVVKDVVEATRYEDASQNDSGGFNATTILIIAIPVLGALVAVAIVLSKKNKSKSETKSEDE